MSGKKITLLGWAFKKDTNDTRESAAIYIADKLMDEGAEIAVYDPKVNNEQILKDLNHLNSRSRDENKKLLTYFDDPYKACEATHAIAIITEWDEFKDYNWSKIYQNCVKPASIFDGRNLLEISKMKKIGFKYYGTGK